MPGKKAKKGVDESLEKEVKRLKSEASRRRSEIRSLMDELTELKTSLFQTERHSEVRFFQLVQAMKVACVMSVPFLENRSTEQVMAYFEYIAKTMGYEATELRPVLRMVLMRGSQVVIEMHTEPVEGEAPGATVSRKDVERAMKLPRLASYI